jgi:hypothetical protein
VRSSTLSKVSSLALRQQVRVGQFSAVQCGLERFADGLNCSKLPSGCEFRVVQCSLEWFF